MNDEMELGIVNNNRNKRILDKYNLNWTQVNI